MMFAHIAKSFTFDSAHRLVNLPVGHPCAEMHGHTWRVKVECRGLVRDTGFVVDFHDLDRIVKEKIASLDHCVVNTIIPNPTSENIAAWLLIEIGKELPEVFAIEVRETPRSWCRVEMGDLDG